jgi:two-component system, response regulator, stage 0 sporulation protein F
MNVPSSGAVRTRSTGREAMAAQKILVIEDVDCLRLLYRLDLETEGYAVVTAAEAFEGLRLFDEESPDLVVLDIRMPGMDGLEAMGRILARNPDIPVVLNSSYSSYKDSFLSWAADAYVIKSADTGELRSRIRDLLQARSMRTLRGSGLVRPAFPAQPQRTGAA